jgi:FAD/FMN-containing dehydrogenase
MSDFLARLSAIVGVEHVLTDPDLRAGYEADWTGRYRGDALAVVRPGTVAEVAAVVRECAQGRVAIVPQGGNSGLVGGTVPPTGAVLLSLRRLDTIGGLDVSAGQITVGAAVTPAALAATLHDSGWEFGVDLGARDTATIGGMVATNAGGIRVLRHGSMRANVLGLEAVLADGSVISRLGGLFKDNTGYDLAGLLCGSEGTLGVVTAARLRLVPTPPNRMLVWIGCDSWADAVGLATTARREIDGIDGLEAIDHDGLAAVEDIGGLQTLFPGVRPAVSLLVAWAGAALPNDAIARLIEDRPNVLAEHHTGVARLWKYREHQTETIGRIGVPHKLDVTLPLARLAEFTADVTELVAPHRLFLFGHLGDGNLHVNVVGPPSDDTALDRAILDLVSRFGGSISAEHGIGRAKRPWLALSRSPEEIRVFRALKHALDPLGILNPGVLI